MQERVSTWRTEAEALWAILPLWVEILGKNQTTQHPRSCHLTQGSAYLGNQQFTTSELVFVNCKTAVQVHWDWAWTMQDVVIESCGTGIVVVGGVSTVLLFLFSHISLIPTRLAGQQVMASLLVLIS
jgi:hypothetical protein